MGGSSTEGRSLAEIAIERFVTGFEAEAKADFTAHCVKFLENHHADAADYAELNLRLASL